LIATQQPLVHDLRTIAAVLNIITDLERMGDHAEGTATISLMIGDEPLLKPLLDIPRMAETVTDMPAGAPAFTDHDVVSARRVAAEDDAVDALYNQVYRELLTFMIGDPRTIHQATLLLWAAHNLERIGDRVTNICERVLFTETGRMRNPPVRRTQDAGRTPLTCR
jgi:phosphate transport system protein